jgi:hypothetical protein
MRHAPVKVVVTGGADERNVTGFATLTAEE